MYRTLRSLLNITSQCKSKVGIKDINMPESSEERKLEISEKITHKFYKVRITSLHNLEKDEQGNHKDASITMRNVKDVYVQQEQLEHRGYHIVGTEEKEWELLNPQNLAGNKAHNGNG